MIRRPFLAIALAAAALSSAAPAVATTTKMPCWLAPPPVMPEPMPIQVDAAAITRATALLDAVAQGTFDVTVLSPELQAHGLTAFFAHGATIVSALGPAQPLVPFERRTTAYATATYFRAQFASQTLTWVVSIDPQDKVTALSLQRNPSCKIFSIVDHGEVQY